MKSSPTCDDSLLTSGSLKDLAIKLLANGPHKLEKTPRRVRALFDGTYVFDTLEARHVWEHPYFPQFYVPTSAVKSGLLTKNDAVDKENSAFLVTLKGKERSTDRAISFEKGPLAGLVRFEFAAMGRKCMNLHPRQSINLDCRLVVRGGPADLWSPQGPVQTH